MEITTKSFPKRKTFCISEKKNCSQKLMLKANLDTEITSIFAIVFGTKRGLVNKGTLCKSATVPAAVIL